MCAAVRSSAGPTEVARKISVVRAPNGDDGSPQKSGNSNSSPEKATVNVNMNDLELYEEDIETVPTLAAFLRSFIIPDSEEKEARERRRRERRKGKLGVLLGVYFPTLQHIFGVIMFLRVFWIVGCSGIFHTTIIIFMCCLCTFLTSISMSAIATNGVVESGGSYFMISRNLGPEFGTSVGILFYLANAVATAMYLVGAVEILLTYLAPGLPQFESSHENMAPMFNNFRLYATGLLIFIFFVVALGVVFVQIFAPISLSCVIISIISIYIGSLVASPDRGAQVCLVGEMLIKQSILLNVSSSPALGCNKTLLERVICSNATGDGCSSYFLANNVTWTRAVPGFASGTIRDNLFSGYLEENYARPGIKGEPWSVMQGMGSSFFILLAIYFPSVTGIMTGSNMSGDLRDPQKSIPLGTISAQLTTSVVYMSFIYVFGGSIIRPVLLDKYGESLGGGMVVAQVAWPSPWVLLIGSFTSTFGAGLQCLCSAPRLLQSIAKDDVLPFLAPFAKLTKRGEPFRALLITALISECAILIGNIDLIAPIVDFFFLMCYGFVNIACALQTLLKAPNWRPRFRYYHWTLSLLGAALSFFIMFSTHWYYALVCIALCAAIYKYVEYNGAKKEWGDGLRGLALTGARFSLLKLEDQEAHTKNWRPQLLCFMKYTEETSSTCSKMLDLVSQLKAGGGLVVCTTVLQGDYADPLLRLRANALEASLKQSLAQHKVKGFAKCLICREVSDGINVAIQSTGMGALRPNTVLVGWPTTWHSAEHNRSYQNFLDSVHRVATADMCLLIPKGVNLFPASSTQLPHGSTIDVWWILHDGGLLFLLPFLLKKHRVWRNCKIRVFAVATQLDNSVRMKECLDKWIYQLRINAEVTVVEMPGPDVSAYVHEKTLQMAKRLDLFRALQLTEKEITTEPQAMIDKVRTSVSGPSSGGESIPPMDGIDLSALSQRAVPKVDSLQVPGQKSSTDDIEKANQFTFSPGSGQDMRKSLFRQESTDVEQKPPVLEAPPRTQPDSKYRKKMHTALKLNLAIHKESSNAALVILNLPRPPRNRESLHNYLSYLEALTENLDKVLLVRGSGREVITIYS